THRAVLARRRKGKVLAEQYGVDRRVAEPLQGNDAAIDAGTEGPGCNAGDSGQLDLAAFLDVMLCLPADGEVLHRTGLRISVERAGEITHARDWRHGVAVTH